MINVSLYAVPAPGQCVEGEDQFLGTVRTHMHKAPLTALAANLEERLREEGVSAAIRIVDMQTQNTSREKYGELDIGGLKLEKYRVGCSFNDVYDSVKESDVVGINANFTHSRLIVRDFVRYVKQKNKKAIVIVGGTDATSDPEYYLRNGADVIVKGEGETTFRKLIRNLHNRKCLEDVSNISYVDGNKIVHNNNNFLRDQYQFDVTTMSPPNLDIVDLSKYIDTGEGNPPKGINGPFISVETSRGCAQACSFCATPSTKGRYRFMKLDTIKEHFKYFKSKGIETLLFQEDNILSRIHRNSSGDYVFLEGREELLEMFRLAKEMSFSWEFTNGLEFGQYEHDRKIDQELIDKMFWHRSEDNRLRGCYRATIPLENLTENHVNLLRKLKPRGVSKDIVRNLAQTGVNTLTFNLIIGRPEDNEDSLRLSYERCLEVRDVVDRVGKGTTTYFNVYNLSLLPGTVDYRNYKDLLAFDLEKDPEVVTFYLGSLKTKHFSPLEITQARGSMVHKLNQDTMVKDFDNNRYVTSERFDRLFS